MRAKQSGSSVISSAKREPWVDPDDGPEWTDEMIANAEIREGDKVIRPGRPPLDELFKKATVTIRLDPDVVEAYRVLGSGWQTKINEDLRKARKLGPKRKTV